MNYNVSKNFMIVSFGILATINQFAFSEGKVKSFSNIQLLLDNKQMFKIQSINDKAIIILARDHTNSNSLLKFDFNTNACLEFNIDQGDITVTEVDRNNNFCFLLQNNGANKIYRYDGKNLNMDSLSSQHAKVYNLNDNIVHFTHNPNTIEMNKHTYMKSSKLYTLSNNIIANTSNLYYFPSTNCLVGVKPNSIWFLNNNRKLKEFLFQAPFNILQVCKVSKEGIIYLIGTSDGIKNSLYVFKNNNLERVDDEIHFTPDRYNGSKTLLFNFNQEFNTKDCYTISKSKLVKIGELPITTNDFTSIKKTNGYPSIIGRDFSNDNFYIYSTNSGQFNNIEDFLYVNYDFNINKELDLTNGNKITDLKLSNDGRRIIGILKNNSAGSSSMHSITSQKPSYSIFNIELENEKN